MSLDTESHGQQHLTMTLELLSEGIYEADLVLVNAVGADIVTRLQQHDYLVEPVPTGLRGGEFLIQITTTLTTDMTSFAMMVWANKETLERVLADASALVVAWGGIIPLLKHMIRVHEVRSEQRIPAAAAGKPAKPMKITVEIDGAPVTVEAEDIEQAEAGIRCAQHFYESHPVVAKNVTPQSKIHVKGHLPAQPQRRRK